MPAADATRPSAAVLIPVHNGGDRLARVLGELSSLPVAIWVADDGSTDGSPERSAAAGARVVALPERRGKGAALRRGLKEILAAGPPEWILFMDGDGQHLASEVPRFLEAMAGPCDFLTGDRMEQAEAFPGHRRVTNRAGSRILKWMSGNAVPDTQCGFRAVRSSLIAGIPLESDGYEIETEILLKVFRQGARWRAVPVSAVYDGQESHFRPVADTFRICMAALRYVAG
jgi:glycosyltransferase involved in cell wall biosynthesis